jgi:hypothetical protein
VNSPLQEYSTIIRSGLTPAPEGAGRLSPERAARLAEQLRSLQAARDRALAESQTYWIVPRDGLRRFGDARGSSPSSSTEEKGQQ